MNSFLPIESPDQIPLQFVEAWNLRDASSIAELFAEDAEFVNVTGLWWHSREAIEKAHAYGLKVIFKDSTLSIRKLQVKSIHPEIAVVHARMQLVGQAATPGTSTPGVRQTLFSFVVQQTGAGWLCVSAHNTDIVPGMETHLVDEVGNMRAVDYRVQK